MGADAKPRPRHVRPAREFLAEIRRETAPLGSPFPTEQDLQGRFGVGRRTIPEAP